MPDTFSASLALTGVWGAVFWLKRGKLWGLFIFLFCAPLAILAKAPSALILASLGVSLFIPSIPWPRKTALSGLGLLALVLPAFWYGFWVPHLKSLGANDLYFPRSFMVGLTELWDFRMQWLDKLVFSPLHSYLGFVLVVFGVGRAIMKRQILLLGITAVVVISYFIFMAIAGSVFALHNYYVIPIVPLLTVLVGVLLASLPKRWAYIALALVCMEGVANQYHDFFIPANRLYPLELAATLDQVTPPASPIIINGGPSPQPLYFAHRYGWTITPEESLNSRKLMQLRSYGAEYLVIDKHLQQNLPTWPPIYENSHYMIFNLASLSH